MPFVINTSAGRHVRTLLDVLCRGRDTWSTDTYTAAKCDVYWVAAEEDLNDRLSKLKPHHRMSRIPGMLELCDKSAFADLMSRTSGSEAYFPRTYLLSEDKHHIPRAAWSRPLIFKPDQGACGEGISLLFSPKDLQKQLMHTKATRAVVQEYLETTLLVDRRKWDIRVYVLVLSLHPLRVFLCNEGLARFACDEYQPATAETSHHIGAHLTNYSISKYATNFEHSDDPSDGASGSKRSLSSLFDYLQKIGHDVSRMQETIRDVTAAATAAIGAQLLGSCESELAASNCFHLIGLDLIFDTDYKAWLLEANCSPSLAVDSVYPCTGAHAEVAPGAPGEDQSRLMRDAWDVMTFGGRKENKKCTCMSHHRPHVHSPCAVDLAVKGPCVEGALLIVKRDQIAKKKGKEVSCEELAHGTLFELIHDETHSD